MVAFVYIPPFRLSSVSSMSKRRSGSTSNPPAKPAKRGRPRFKEAKAPIDLDDQDRATTLVLVTLESMSAGHLSARFDSNTHLADKPPPSSSSAPLDPISLSPVGTIVEQQTAAKPKRKNTTTVSCAV